MKRSYRNFFEGILEEQRKTNLLLEQVVRLNLKVLSSINNWHSDDTKYHHKTFKKLDAVKETGLKALS